MNTPRNPEAVARLATLIRELAKRDEYRHLAHYGALIASLQTFHDAMNGAPAGSAEYFRAHDAATKVYRAAREHARRHGLETPNSVMKICGYVYAPKA